MSDNKLKIIISGGGTGGHIYPAIAIADAIMALRPEADIRFVGAKGKMEMEKVPKAGYPIEGLWISGFHRQLTLRNLMFPFKLLSSLWKAGGILRRFRPQLAIGVGGYASGPLLYMATQQGISTLIQEQNSYPGITNRLLAKRVDKACVSYPGMERFIPAHKLVRTGNPVRTAIRHSDATRAQGAAYFGFDPERPIILVFGGSLGARGINQAMAANADLLRERMEVQVLWQYGQLYEEAFSDSLTAHLPNVRAQAYIDRMDLAYAMADVVVCRAGALTISELQCVGKPALFIPSPNVAEDHQTKNAMAMVEQDAAEILAERDADAMMMRRAMALLDDAPRRSQLSETIKKLAQPDAAERIAKEALALID